MGGFNAPSRNLDTYPTAGSGVPLEICGACRRPRGVVVYYHAADLVDTYTSCMHFELELSLPWLGRPDELGHQRLTYKRHRYFRILRHQHDFRWHQQRLDARQRLPHRVHVRRTARLGRALRRRFFRLPCRKGSMALLLATLERTARVEASRPAGSEVRVHSLLTRLTRLERRGSISWSGLMLLLDCAPVIAFR